MDIFLILLSFAAVVIIIALYLRNANRESDYEYNANVYSFDRLFREVQESLTDIIKEDTYEGLSDAELFQAKKVKRNITAALRNCVFAVDSDKELVIDLIVNIIKSKLPKEEDLVTIIDFDDPFLRIDYKWEILLYWYTIRLGKGLEAFNCMAEEFDLLKPKKHIEDKRNYSYVITGEEIEDIYNTLNISLTHEDKNLILARIIFSRYKGFGCIDTIRAQNINGISIGNSGAIMTHLGQVTHKATSSVWLNCNSRYVHLEFLDMHSEDEVRRIVQLALRWQSPGPLTEKVGALVNTMYDKSRILGIRPPLSEYWGMFIRKFSRVAPTIEDIIFKNSFKNCETIYLLLLYLYLGLITQGYTGRQGSGKTTFMRAAIKFFDPRYNIRVLEMAAELYLRETYPQRNIMSFFETPWCPISVAQDAQKKSDGAITIFGEVATDAAAARLIQSCQVAALCCIFSHHGVSPADMIRGLTNSVANDQGVTNIETIEYQVVRAIHINIDLAVDTNGKRWVNYITEIIPLESQKDYPIIDNDNPLYSFIDIFREYAVRSTDRPMFITKDLVRFDQDLDSYYTVNTPSVPLINKMRNSIPPEYTENFIKFLDEAFIKNKGNKEQINYSDPILEGIENRNKGVKNSEE